MRKKIKEQRLRKAIVKEKNKDVKNKIDLY